MDWSDCCSRLALQPSSCCQREMLWCGSQLWIVYWVSRLVLCRTLQLNFLPDVDDLMIDLGCPYLRHLSDSGPFVRRPLHVLRVV